MEESNDSQENSVVEDENSLASKPMRENFKDYIRQFKEGAARDMIDQDGDRNVFIKDIPVLMELLNEPKISDEKLKTIIQELNLKPGQDSTKIEHLLQTVVPYLDNYGSKDEFVQAFRVLDLDGKGEIPVNKFRYYMLQYGMVDPDQLDLMIMDIFGMKKNGPIDPNKPVDYMAFAAKIFDPPPPKNPPKKTGKRQLIIFQVNKNGAGGCQYGG